MSDIKRQLGVGMGTLADKRRDYLDPFETALETRSEPFGSPEYIWLRCGHTPAVKGDLREQQAPS